MNLHPPPKMVGMLIPQNRMLRLWEKLKQCAVTTFHLITLRRWMRPDVYVARNYSIPPEVLAQLARDPDAVTRQIVAHRTVPPEVLARLTDDKVSP